MTAAHNGNNVVSIHAETLSDLGNARRLVRLHGEYLRYEHSAGRWLVWDCQRWTDAPMDLERRAKDTAAAMLTEAAQLPADKRQDAAKHALRSMNATPLRNMVDLARSEPGIPVHSDELDAHPLLLNVDNGILDLRTGQLGPHRPEALCTRLAPVAFDAAARAPTFHAFLARITGGDQDLERFLQRLAGYSLTGLTTEQVLPVLHGSGANGKTTLVELLRELLGDYGTTMPPDLLVQRRDGSQQPHGLVRLRGARFVAASETEDGARLSVALVKQITGGDTVTARRLYGEFFDFRPVAKVWLSTNHRPRIDDSTESIWRRVRLVPFAVTIPEAERDPQLPAKLRRELPGVLNWALEGCLKWQRDGLGTTDAVRGATGDYRAESDLLAAFLEDRCLTGPAYYVAAGELFAAWQTWCAGRGEKASSARSLGVRLAERGFTAARSGHSGTRIWRGLGLLADAADAADTDAEKVT